MNQFRETHPLQLSPKASSQHIGVHPFRLSFALNIGRHMKDQSLNCKKINTTSISPTSFLIVGLFAAAIANSLFVLEPCNYLTITKVPQTGITVVSI